MLRVVRCAVMRVWVVLAFAGVGCGSNDDGDGGGGTQGPQQLDEPYGRCGDPEAPTQCDVVDEAVAACDVRDDAATMQSYSVCRVACADDADCPLVEGGNLPPRCHGAETGQPGRCAIVCAAGGANSCPQQMVCVDGDPPQCMWPGEAASHETPEDFCMVACEVCGGALLLPWTDDCPAQCVADLQDCSEAELTEVFACTGGATCPAGGGAVADCLETKACVDGA